MTPSSNRYDVLIVGAGVAGCALAHGLATITASSRSKPLKIGLLERSFAEPDRIVGELLQPGGCAALRKLGMEDCLDNIGAVPVRGYCVVNDGKQVHIPYPDGHEGRSFHHGRFIMSLRKKACEAPGVMPIEATVSSLITAPIWPIATWTSSVRHANVDGCVKRSSLANIRCVSLGSMFSPIV